jgi:hypothetical protein
MGSYAASIFDFVRAARTWVARYVGISGLGTNPTNPWCQHPSRPPLHHEPKSKTIAAHSEVWAGPHCFICGLPVTHDNGGGQHS